MSAFGSGMWHKRHHDFESFDKITFEIVPRYKESGISGDEWRQHVEVQFWFKGHIVHSAGFGNMRTALMMTSAEWIRAQEPILDTVIKIEEDTCDQPSCGEPPIHRYILKDRFSNKGEKLDKSDGSGRQYYRQFCEKHGVRGDCGREDSDNNYIKEPI